MNKDAIFKLQKLLNALGADPLLQVDGELGPKTKLALDLELRKRAPESKVDFALDMEGFKAKLPSAFGKLYSDKQLPGYEIITRKFFELGYKDLRWLSYLLATAFHETAHTMKPVKEYGSQAYLRAKKYWPFIGMGYVQLTWDYNYKKYGILNNPEKALEPDFAAFILIDGSVNGVFTGKKLSHYFNDKTNSPIGARRIINGIDKAELIAGYHNKILSCLQSSIIDKTKTLTMEVA